MKLSRTPGFPVSTSAFGSWNVRQKCPVNMFGGNFHVRRDYPSPLFFPSTRAPTGLVSTKETVTTLVRRRQPRPHFSMQVRRERGRGVEEMENTQVTRHMVCLLGDNASAPSFVLTTLSYSSIKTIIVIIALASSPAPPLGPIKFSFPHPPSPLFPSPETTYHLHRHLVEEDDWMGVHPPSIVLRPVK